MTACPLTLDDPAACINCWETCPTEEVTAMQTAATHTPGPWTWAPVHDDDEYPTITIMAEPWKNQPGTVQHVAKLSSWGKWDDPEVIANANLMTAAPDLLAVLRAFLDQVPELYGDHVYEGDITLVIPEEVIEMAHAAVWKATH